MIRLRYALFLPILLWLATCSSVSGTQDVLGSDSHQDQGAAPPDAVPDSPFGGDSSLDEHADTLPDLGVDTPPSLDTQSDAQPSEITKPSDALSPDSHDVVQLEDTFVDLAPADHDVSPDGVSMPLPGFGQLTGECGVLDEEELLSPLPYLFVNQIDFGETPYAGNLDVLSPGAQEVFTDGNAGGSSALSETFSFDVLYRCELATLVKTETEVLYTTPGKMTDILVEVDGVKIGVSVTRAFVMNCSTPYTLASAKSLLDKKLKGIQASSALVAPEDAWQKQILHMLTCGPEHLALVKQAWDELVASPDATTVVGDTILIITVTEGDDGFIYEE